MDFVGILRVGLVAEYHSVDDHLDDTLNWKP